MAVIKLQSNFIEFPFENTDGKTVLTLKFDKSDENIKKLEKTITQFEKEEDKLMAKENATFEDGKKLFKKSIDSVFGEGSFDAMFALSPSTLVIKEYFAQMVDGIFNEINNDNAQKKLDKYLS